MPDKPRPPPSIPGNRYMMCTHHANGQQINCFIEKNFLLQIVIFLSYVTLKNENLHLNSIGIFLVRP